jgi:hypothetical protein
MTRIAAVIVRIAPRVHKAVWTARMGVDIAESISRIVKKARKRA